MDLLCRFPILQDLVVLSEYLELLFIGLWVRLMLRFT